MKSERYHLHFSVLLVMSIWLFMACSCFFLPLHNTALVYPAMIRVLASSHLTSALTCLLRQPVSVIICRDFTPNLSQQLGESYDILHRLGSKSQFSPHFLSHCQSFLRSLNLGCYFLGICSTSRASLLLQKVPCVG